VQLDRHLVGTDSFDVPGELKATLVELRATCGGDRFGDVRGSYRTEQPTTGTSRRRDLGLHGPKLFADLFGFVRVPDIARLASAFDRLDLLLSALRPRHGE